MAMAVLKTLVSCIIVHIMALWVGLLFRGGAEAAQCKSPCPSVQDCGDYSDAEAGFCASSKYVLRAQQRLKYEQYSYSQLYTTSCWLNRCNEYRTRYTSRAAYYTTYSQEYECSSYCCAGYAGTAPNNCKPQCPTACLNGGTCTAPDTCTCAPGYRGGICQEAVCDPPCVHGTCEGPSMCTCQSGYTGSTCADDINECTEIDGPCLQICTNKIGSYECSCYEGYLIGLSGDCEDIDECTNQDYPHDCSAGCVNTIGSFSCTCNTGYRLNPVTNKDCYDIDECDELSPCDHNCTNIPGSFSCSCALGFQLVGETTCQDIDECSSASPPCHQLCTNSPGSFTCSCKSGFLVMANGMCEGWLTISRQRGLFIPCNSNLHQLHMSAGSMDSASMAAVLTNF